MPRLLPNVFSRFLDSNGDPLSGGKVYFYVAGTSTPLATYQDSTWDVPNTNPVILDADGYADIWLGSGVYKVVLTDANDVVQWTKDDISADLSNEVGPAAGIYSGTTDPDNSLGVDGEFYIRTDTWEIFGPKASGAWPAGVSILGDDGTNGNTVLNGDASGGYPDDSIGVDGDFFIDTYDADWPQLVGPKASGTWVGSTITVLAGEDGAAGADGATWYQGSGAPGGGTGVDGDFYFRTDNGAVYQKSGAITWNVIANLTGPTGATGATGSTGATGATGPTYMSSTTNGTTNLTNLSNVDATKSVWEYQRFGRFMYFDGIWVCNGSGGGAANLTLTVPSSLTVDTTYMKVVAPGGANDGLSSIVQGHATWTDVGVAWKGMFNLFVDSTSSNKSFRFQDSGGHLDRSSFGSGDSFRATFFVPILEWSGLDYSTQISSSIVTDTFTGDGSTTGFTMSSAAAQGNMLVFMGGVYQPASTYSVASTTLTFSSAPPNGVGITVIRGSITDIGAPSAGSVSRSSLATGAVGNLVVTNKTASFTASTSDDLYTCNATSGAIVPTLPAASSCNGKRFWFKKTDSSSNAVTITRAGSDTIDGATTYALNAQYEAVQIISDGTNWQVF